MKKLVLLLTLFAGLCITSVNAQGGGDPAVREARMKEMKTQLMGKAKLSETEADKVMEINMSSREQMRGMRDLSPEDRTKKMDEMQAALSKKFKAIPLTDEQVKAVNEYMAERRKNMQQRQGGGGNL